MIKGNILNHDFNPLNQVFLIPLDPRDSIIANVINLLS